MWILDKYIFDMDTVLFVCDINNTNSIYNIIYIWYEHIKRYNINFKIYIAVNKCYQPNYNENITMTGSYLFIKRTDSMEDSNEIRNNINNLLNKNSTYLMNSRGGCYLTNEEYLKCIYYWSTNTGSSVDWLILNNLLNTNWASFGMFWVEFSNGKALINAIFVTSAVISSGSAMAVISQFF
jgi:hypothetical protein